MLLRASELETPSSVTADTAFALAGLIGRLTVIEGLAGTAYAASLLCEAQARAHKSVWISSHPAPVYPPDLVRCGVDCNSLPFVHVPDARSAFEAAEICLRSKAFGLIIIDNVPEHSGDKSHKSSGVGQDPHEQDLHGQETHSNGAGSDRRQLGGIARLARIAEHNRVALLILGDTTSAYASAPLVSHRIAAERQPAADGRFVMKLTLLKDKRGTRQLSATRMLYGPDAMY